MEYCYHIARTLLSTRSDAAGAVRLALDHRNPWAARALLVARWDGHADAHAEVGLARGQLTLR
jgi:hypothetical protein